MDLMRVDKETYLPNKLITGYSSLIWTERFWTAGEFELRTPKIDDTKKLIPEGALLTHRETDEVMIVESHYITKNQEGFKELLVKGRSFETIAEDRTLEGPYPKKKYKMARQYTAAEAAEVILWNAFVNPTTNDVTRLNEDYTRDLKDNIPNVAITHSTSVEGTSKRRWLTGGQVYPQVLALLRQNKLGIRTIRPVSNPGNVVSVSTGDKGIISYSNPSTTDKLRIDIYSGKNRTKKQDVEKAVVFHYAGKYMTDESYLFSIADYITMVQVVSGVGTKKYYRSRAEDAPKEGLERRVLWVDGGEPELKEIPDEKNAGETDQEFADRKADLRAQNAATKAEFLDDLKDKADEELDRHDRVRAFECKIDTNSGFDYREDYFLGDKVTLVGEYDFEQTMWVAEYVRTEDKTGDVGYPGLAADMDDATT